MSTSEQVRELGTAFAASIERLCALIDNRSAWSDAIAGCREALMMITNGTEKLKAIHYDAQQIETDLATSRAENAILGRNYAELEKVERELRPECDAAKAELRRIKAEAETLRGKYTAVVAAERALRAELEQYRAAFEQRSAAVANAQSLAEQLLSETSCL